jgi:hypothetical protein
MIVLSLLRTAAEEEQSGWPSHANIRVVAEGERQMQSMCHPSLRHEQRQTQSLGVPYGMPCPPKLVGMRPQNCDSRPTFRPEWARLP